MNYGQRGAKIQWSVAAVVRRTGTESEGDGEATQTKAKRAQNFR